MKACIFVLCWMGVQVLSAVAYKAGVVDSSNNDVASILPFVYEAGEKNVDILLLPSDITNSKDSYDDTVKALSKAAKQAGLYLVAHLTEMTVCQKMRESMRSNLVFDRQGTIIAAYRKPITNVGNCTAPIGSTTFSTDFGVSFGLMMEEDLVLKSPGLNVRNFAVAGAWASEILFLSASHFTSAWAYTASSNVLSRDGIFAGRAGVKTGAGTGAGTLVVAELKNNSDDESVPNPPVVNPVYIKNFSGEDLNQYIFRPLDVEASRSGYKESVCHNNFCCQFNVKTTYRGPKQEVNYGLAAFDGIRHYGDNHYIGAQNCAVFACADLYKKSCRIGFVNNNTNIVFEKLIIAANFSTENSIQYPVILSNDVLPADKFNFVTKSDNNSKEVKIELADGDNLLAFGIFGRDFENDYENSFENKNNGYGIYDYIFTEDLQELFDYLWIRLRILVFIVSIYVLEMM